MEGDGTELYSIKDSNRSQNDEWDAFLARHPFGHHVQTHLWSRMKAGVGWSASRIVVEAGGEIVGGAQMLMRDVKLLGKVGYVPKGPLLPNDEHDLADRIIDALLESAARSGIKMLFVQPHNDGASLEPLLLNRSFRLWPVAAAPTATVLVDLSCDLDMILARMSKGMRHGIRRSEKGEIRVREGTQDDIPAFHLLLKATAERQNFPAFSLDYFQKMWSVLHPAGCVKLFVCELGDEAVSAQIIVPFGNTVTAKQIGWSGNHGRLRPNEALDWATMKWAKANGFTFYDLEGIDRVAAKAVMDHRELPKRFAESPTSYKLRLGGNVQLFPQTYCYVANPILRSAYNRFGYRIANQAVVKKTINRIRTR